MYNKPLPITHERPWKPREITLEEVAEGLTRERSPERTYETVRAALVYHGTQGREAVQSALCMLWWKRVPGIHLFFSDRKRQTIEYALQQAKTEAAEGNYERAAVDFLIAARLDANILQDQKEKSSGEKRHARTELYTKATRSQRDAERAILVLYVNSLKAQRTIEENEHFVDIGEAIIHLYQEDRRAQKLYEEIDRKEKDEADLQQIIVQAAFMRYILRRPTLIVPTEWHFPVNADSMMTTVIKNRNISGYVPDRSSHCPCGSGKRLGSCHFDDVKKTIERLNGYSENYLNADIIEVVKGNETVMEELRERLETARGELNGATVTNLFTTMPHHLQEAINTIGVLESPMIRKAHNDDAGIDLTANRIIEKRSGRIGKQ